MDNKSTKEEYLWGTMLTPGRKKISCAHYVLKYTVSAWQYWPNVLGIGGASKKEGMHVQTQAMAVASKFKCIFSYFSKCHRGYNSNVISKAAVDTLGKYMYVL